MMFLLFQGQPWWVTAIGGGVGLVLGLLGALPWRSAAEAAKSERDSMRDARNRSQEEAASKDTAIALLKKDVEILKARTDLDGFRAKVETMFVDLNHHIENSQVLVLGKFQEHASQDEKTAEQTLAALTALTEKIKSESLR